MLSRHLYFSVLVALIVLHLHVSTDWSKWKWAALYVYSIRNYFLKLTAFFFFVCLFCFFQCSCWNTMRAILSLSWCKQRKSTLDLKHMDHAANFLHMCIRQSTSSRRHSCLPGCQGWTPDLYQHRWILFGFCLCSEKSSDTHDTPRYIQMDSHSEWASSALSHVSRHSRRHKVHCGLGDFCEKG